MIDGSVLSLTLDSYLFRISIYAPKEVVHDFMKGPRYLQAKDWVETLAGIRLLDSTQRRAEPELLKHVIRILFVAS